MLAAAQEGLVGAVVPHGEVAVGEAEDELAHLWRCTGDVGEMQGRCKGDVREM